MNSATAAPSVLEQLEALWNATPTANASAERGKRKSQTTPRQSGNVSRETLPNPIFIDLETRSTCDIKKGGRRYAQDATTELMTAVAMLDGRVIAWSPLLDEAPPTAELWPEGFEKYGYQRLPIESFAGPELPQILREEIDSGRPLCAHNAVDFDAHVWRALGLPEPREWLDTLPHARAAGFPGKLEDLGQRLIGRGKDKHGAALLKRYYKPNSSGDFPPFTSEIAKQILQYNVADVLLLSTVFHAVWGHAESEMVSVDRTINERGMAFDRELAERLITFSHQLLDDVAQAMERQTGGTITRADLNRTEFLRQWLSSQGVALPNLQRKTITVFLEQYEAGNAPAGLSEITVLKARLVASRTAGSKLTKAISVIDRDDRLRDLLLYHKGHTGRWAGRGVQPQNLPQPHKDLQDFESLLEATHDFEVFKSRLPKTVAIEEGISALLRPCFRAAAGKTLCTSDFASVEARGVAWLAKESVLLDRFSQRVDVYCDLASQLYNSQVSPKDKAKRKIGKTAVLGCGYGMGPDRFAEQAAAAGLDLKAAGISAREVVEGYRDAYPAIAGTLVTEKGHSWRCGGLWRDLERAGRDAISQGGQRRAGRCIFEYTNTSLVVTLPSNRKMFYRNAQIEKAVPSYYKKLGLTPVSKPTLVYDHPQHGATRTYGGKLCENLVQAVCRDLLASAILECERQGLPVVLHVHDDIVIEVPRNQSDEALRQLAQIMSTPPPWAEGFSVEVEAFSAERYFKSPPPSAQVVKAQNGVIL